MYTVKNESIQIYYDEDTNSIDLKSEESSSQTSSLSSSFSSTSSESTSSKSGKLADIRLYTDNKTKNLFAVCNSNANVHYKSHCLEEEEKRRLEPYVPVEIFDFDNLFDTLISEDYIAFDPSEATLSFENNFGTKIFVTLTSKAASGLFKSLTD